MARRIENRPTKLAAKIAEIAKAAGIHVGEGPFVLHRTRAGYWQRSAGAWSWYLTDREGVEVAGSPHTTREIVEAAREGRVGKMEDSYNPTSELFVEAKLPESMKRRVVRALHRRLKELGPREEP